MDVRPAARPNPEQIRPTGLHLDRQKSLTVEWADGQRSIFPLSYLRGKCPCAACRTERDNPRPAATGRSLTILPANFDRQPVAADAGLVGNYAIQIRWADGHSTGIYDFAYLRSIDPADQNSAGT